MISKDREKNYSMKTLKKKKLYDNYYKAIHQLDISSFLTIKLYKHLDKNQYRKKLTLQHLPHYTKN